MYSTVHAHVDTCGFKREQVICSDNVWLSEVMFGKRCGARVRGDGGGQLKDSKRDFLWALAGGITPQQSASIHKKSTRNPQGIHKNHSRFSQDFHKNPIGTHKNFTSPNNRNPAEITSVFHVKTLEYVCHTGRTHEP